MSLFTDVAHDYVEMAAHPAQIRHQIDRAFRIALDERQPTCLILGERLADKRIAPRAPGRRPTDRSAGGRQSGVATSRLGVSEPF